MRRYKPGALWLTLVFGPLDYSVALSSRKFSIRLIDHGHTHLPFTTTEVEKAWPLR